MFHRYSTLAIVVTIVVFAYCVTAHACNLVTWDAADAITVDINKTSPDTDNLHYDHPTRHDYEQANFSAALTDYDDKTTSPTECRDVSRLSRRIMTIPSQ